MIKYLSDKIEECVGLVVMCLGIIGLIFVWDKEIGTLFLIASVLGLILAKGGRHERMLRELKELSIKESSEKKGETP